MDISRGRQPIATRAAAPRADTDALLRHRCSWYSSGPRHTRLGQAEEAFDPPKADAPLLKRFDRAGQRVERLDQHVDEAEDGILRVKRVGASRASGAYRASGDEWSECGWSECEWSDWSEWGVYRTRRERALCRTHRLLNLQTLLGGIDGSVRDQDEKGGDARREEDERLED